MNVYGYTRFSTGTQHMSAEVQREKVAAYAAYRFSKPPDAWFEDDAVSGKVPLAQRPAGARLLLAVERGDHVVFAKTDRGFRRIADLCVVMDRWHEQGVTMHLLDINVDTNSETGKAMVRMMGVFAELERARISERTKEGLAARKARGRPCGRAPYGFTNTGRKGDRNFMPFPRERELGAYCLGLMEQGYNREEIARHLRVNKIRHPRTGREIHESSVRRWVVGEMALRQREATAGLHGTPGTV